MTDETTKARPGRYKYKYKYKYATPRQTRAGDAPDEQRSRRDERQQHREEQHREEQHERAEQKDKPEQEQAGWSPARRRLLMFGIAGVFLLAGLIWLLLWIFVFSQREITDDAYVGGNQVLVSAKITGTVIEIGADVTQRVKAGQILVRLDPVDARAALKRAEANLAQAVRQVRQQHADAAQFEALVASRRVDLQRLRADLARREPLLPDEALPPEEVAHAREAYRNGLTALTQAQQQAAAARALIDGTGIADNPAVQQAMASFRDAWVNQARTAIFAPMDGYVAQRQAQLGQTVQPGENLFTIVPLDDLWVDANFKEGQLQHIRIGQRAEIKPDMYHDDVVFHGRVIGLAPGTGGAFALLPPQNASGNWIKVVRRLPVRIGLDAKELERHPLRVGLSTTTRVDTRDRSGAVLAAEPARHPIAQTDVYARELERADAEAQRIVLDNLAPRGLGETP